MARNGEVLSWRGALGVVSSRIDGYRALASYARCFLPAGLLASELGVVFLAGRVLGQARLITRSGLVLAVQATVPRADGSMASSVSRSARAVGGKSLNVSAILQRYGRCGLKSVTSGSFAFA